MSLERRGLGAALRGSVEALLLVHSGSGVFELLSAPARSADPLGESPKLLVEMQMGRPHPEPKDQSIRRLWPGSLLLAHSPGQPFTQ